MLKRRGHSYLSGKKTLVMLVLLSTGLTYAEGQSRRERFDPDGSFWILGKTPTEFSDFSGINLNVKRMRQLPATGVQLSSGKNLRFSRFKMSRQNLSFTTITLAGVSYEFQGRFLKGGVFMADNLDDQKPVLEGVLIKYKSGQKVAQAQLKFSYFGGT